MTSLPRPPAVGIAPLLAVSAVCAGFAAMLYALLQPTVLSNPGTAAYKAPPGVLLYSGAGTASQNAFMTALLDVRAISDPSPAELGETAAKAPEPPSSASPAVQAGQQKKSKESSRPKKPQRAVARVRDGRSRTVMTFPPEYGAFGRWWN